MTSTTRTKAASTPLLARSELGGANLARLEADRLSINNRLSGTRTQLKRNPAKREALVQRLRELLELRDAVNTEIAKRKVADGTARPSEQAMALAADKAAGDEEVATAGKGPKKASTRKPATPRRKRSGKATTAA